MELFGTEKNMPRTESQTRKEIIDEKLAEAGWPVSDRTKAVEEFDTNLSTQQLSFFNILRDYMIDQGDFTKQDLIQPPFASIHPKGILGVFSRSETEKIVQLTESLVA